MTGDTLQDIINFAIKREDEAAKFYDNLSKKVTDKTLKQELVKLKAVEEGHSKRLQNLDLNAIEEDFGKKVMDLKIAKYIVAKEPSEDMQWEDLLTIAMQREATAMELYNDLAMRTSNQAAKKLFESLANEEASHKLYFEKQWDEGVMREN